MNASTKGLKISWIKPDDPDALPYFGVTAIGTVAQPNTVVDEKAEARKRVKEDVRKKRKALYN